MSLVVPFDGSRLAEAALVRASEYAATLEEDVVTVTVLSERKQYAREKGWIEADEPYDVEQVAEDLRERVLELVPGATFEHEIIREFPPAEGIADRIERLALEHDPSIVFLGTENIGRIVTPISSVGMYVAADDVFEVYLVRNVQPPKLDLLEPHPHFYDEVQAADNSES